MSSTTCDEDPTELNNLLVGDERDRFGTGCQ